MKEFMNDPVWFQLIFYACLVINIVLLFPYTDMREYLKLAKKRHYTLWGAVVHLADNMETETDSPLSYYFFDFLTVLIVILLVVFLFR